MKAIATAQAIGPVTLTLELSCDGAAPPSNPPPVIQPPPGVTEFTVNGDFDGPVLAGNDWTKRVDSLPAHPDSAAMIAAQPVNHGPSGHRLQNDFGPDLGIVYSTGRGWPLVPVDVYLYASESDLGPRPIPPQAPIERGPDKHLIYLDTLSNAVIELGMAERLAGGALRCEACAVFQRALEQDQRKVGNTSADAAGLCILSGLVRFEEMERALAQPNPADRHLGHAIRYTLKNTGHGFVYPARHYADPENEPVSISAPPMGIRGRFKSTLDLAQFNPPSRVIALTWMLFGGICADNGSSFFYSGTEDPRWSKYFDAITGNTDDGRSIKGFGGQAFLDHFEFVAYDEADLVTQV